MNCIPGITIEIVGDDIVKRLEIIADDIINFYKESLPF